MSVDAIRTAIKTELDTLKGSGKPFGNVYDYFTTTPTWFPVAMFEPTKLDSEFNTNTENLRTFGFQIIILQEMTNENRQSAIDIVTKAFDEVINAFDDNFTLWWVVELVNAVAGEFWDWNFENWPMYYWIINLFCKVLHTN